MDPANTPTITICRRETSMDTSWVYACVGTALAFIFRGNVIIRTTFKDVPLSPKWLTMCLRNTPSYAH